MKYYNQLNTKVGLIIAAFLLIANSVNAQTFTARSGSVTFTINGVAYSALGEDVGGFLDEVWKFNPTLNLWEFVTTFPGTARSEAVAFVIGGTVYIGTGIDGGGMRFDDF